MSLSKRKRIAAIDIGTNSFHLIIVEINEQGELKLLERQREFLRLGSESGEDLSFITENEKVKAIAVLKNFSILAQYHKASIRAVSTSAVREAKNKNEFIQGVFEQTGVMVETIEGTEEAKLIYLGMKNALPINDKSILGIDIGGGSTEFIYGVNGSTVFAESVKIGAVRLSKKFFPDFVITESSIKNCSEYVEHQIKLNNNIQTNLNLDFAVGSSGTVDTICLIKQFQNKTDIKPRLNGYTFNKSEFDEIYSFVMSLKHPAERMNVPGIEAKRADIIPAGFIILKKVFNLFNIKEMVLSEYALREGVVFDLINKNHFAI
jgi:exopolyphosphatase / guanosine-5'-triphosphate,3'-diphosphate pyrophosphatase